MEEEKPKEMTLKLMPDLLYRPQFFMGYSKPDPKANFHLYDRVVNVSNGISVPLGLKGVIIGVHEDPVVEVNSVYDVLFDEEFPGGVSLRCSPGRGYKMSAANLINLTYGAAKTPKAKNSRNAILNSAIQPSRKEHNDKKSTHQHQGHLSVNGGNDRRNGNNRTEQQPMQVLQRPEQIPEKPHKTTGATAPAMMTVEQLESQCMMPPPAKNVSANGNAFRRIDPSLLLFGEKGGSAEEAKKENGNVDSKKTSTKPRQGKVSINDILMNAGANNVTQTVHVSTPRPQSAKTVAAPFQSTQQAVKKTHPRSAAELSFIPTQVSRNSKANTPGKQQSKPNPSAASSSGIPLTKKTTSGEQMMSVEDLEQHLYRTAITPDRQRQTSESVSTSSPALTNKTPSSGKKRHAINL
jgi:hypothetical protein